MDRYPETEITDVKFFNTVNDLETYTNSFYEYLDYAYTDEATDNVVYIEESYFYSLLRGEINHRNVGKWEAGTRFAM